MNILMVNTLYPPSKVGGAERSVALLAQALAARGARVTVACTTDQPDRHVEQVNGVEIHRFPLRNIYWPYTASHQPIVQRFRWHWNDRKNDAATADLAGLLREVRPQVLHTNNLPGFSTEIWKIAREAGVRTVHTLRDYSLLCNSYSLFRNGSDCDKRCGACAFVTARKKTNSKWVDKVASISRYVIDTHRKFGYFRDTDTRIIYNIANEERENFNSARVTDDSSSDTVTLGFIGRIEPEKGIEITLRAVKAAHNKNWRLKIAGVGREEYVSALRTQYDDPRIEWMGYVGGDEFFGKIDVAVLSSLWPEPLGRTLIESMARGVPVLFSDAGGMPEIGCLASQGQMYPRYDWQALADQIDAVLSAPTQWKKRSHPSADALDRFSEEAVVNAYLELYGFS